MVLTLLLGWAAFAEVPLPVHPDCAEDDLGACPNDLRGWEFTSWVPDNSKDSVRPVELDMGSGTGLDVAVQYSTGRWDVPIAILDSGIIWNESRIARKILINDGELPQPQHADGTLVADWDLDGNGLVNISDYAEDPRVDITAGVDSADGRLDASDLIHTFSDGVDDDGNGYVDDIAGWDFFGFDNDPFAELQSSYYSHGTGVMRSAAEEGGDGGGLGVCPSCSILPIRVGDTFITDGDRVGLGIAYAADRGARVVGMAIGSLTHPELATAAIHYADDMGVVLVGAAGDENSYHHNLPSMRDPILYVHSVRGDNSDENGGGVYSFFNFINCNNFGPRVDLVATTADCATGSVARISGAAGLVVSAGLDVGLDLDPDEVRALLRWTADDVWLTEGERAIARTYPSSEGWDAWFGYGRTNVGNAVQRVFEGDLPPAARIREPDWFSWVDPRQGPVEVWGRVDARNDEGLSWQLMLGRGAEPTEWVEVGAGAGAVDGLLAEVDLSRWEAADFADLRNETVVERMVRAHKPMAHLRLVVTDGEGLVSEERRGLWVRDDDWLLPGFPKPMGSSMEASPVLVDLDDDGVLEIVLPTSDGAVHALYGTGEELDGFPVLTDIIGPLADEHHLAEAYTSGAVPEAAGEGVVGTAAVGDLDGDGDLEIVVASLRGGVYAWHTDGTEVDGFPVRIEGRAPEEFGRNMGWDNGIAAAPSLADVDGDGAVEVIVAAMDQRLYVWDGAGTTLDGYPLELCSVETCEVLGARIVSSPALGDIDGDGDLDAALGTNEIPTGATGLLYLVDLGAAEVWEGWPRKREGLVNQAILPLLGEGHPSSLAMADLDGDGDLELASNPMLGSGNLIDHDGSIAVELSYVAENFGHLSNFDEGAILAIATNPAFGDMDMDGVPDYLLGGASVMYLVSLALVQEQDYQQALGGWSGANGSMLDGFPRQVDDVSFLMAPTVADLTGDGAPEVVYGSGGFLAYAWNEQGGLAPGWPHFTGGWIIGSVALGDVDGDGYLDAVVGTREGDLFAWATEGPADGVVEWASLHHDAQNSGNYHWPLPVQAGPPEQPGGCCKGDGDGSAAFLFLLPLVALRRHR